MFVKNFYEVIRIVFHRLIGRIVRHGQKNSVVKPFPVSISVTMEVKSLEDSENTGTIALRRKNDSVTKGYMIGEFFM